MKKKMGKDASERLVNGSMSVQHEPRAKKTSAKKTAEVYVPQRGDRVRYVFDDTDEWGEGVIVAAGPEGSTWRADGDRIERHRTNRDFQLVERAKEGVRVTTAPRQAARAAIEKSGFPPTAVMARAKAGNPKRPGSGAHGRWELMLQHCDRGDTVGEFLKNGGNPTTLKNGVAKGYARVNDGRSR